MSTQDDFRQKLALIVDLAGVSRSGLAREIGIDKSVVSRWVSGSTRPSAASLDQLTARLANRVAGLHRSDWERPLEAFTAKFRTSALLDRRMDAAVAHDGGAAPASRQEVTFCTTADQVHLAVASMGAGPALVKAPNWLNHVEYDLMSPAWGPTFTRLARNYRFCRYDARGNGLSDWDISDVTFENSVGDLQAVIDGLGLDKVSLLGLSQGAPIAVAYAARHPDRVSRLLLHGCYGRGRHRRNNDLERKKSEMIDTLITTGWGNDNPVYNNALASFFIPSGAPDQIRSFALLQRVSAPAANVLRLKAMLDEIDITGLLPTINVPTLVTHSRHDQMVPIEEGRLVAAAIPGARFVTLESDNHVILPGEPEWDSWMSLIESFPRDARQSVGPGGGNTK
jgi:pimeloyl-ACP methyl ester carboxylesterase/transcriptional regulator with XRE-family HTH domain